MTLSIKYILFIALIHLTTLVMSFFIFQDQKLIFIGSEVIILCSLYFSYRLYRSLVRPIQLISQGVEAMSDRDFSLKFQPVGQSEVDQLIGVYNKMIEQLREERTHKAQQHFFLDKLIRTSPTGIIILDLEGNISTCNPKAAQLLNLREDELLGKSPNQLHKPLLQALAAMPDDSTETIQINGIATYKCHKAHFMDRGFPNHFILIEELTAEKLAIEKQSYSKVIRMMAHEVNNSIGPINSLLDSIRHYHTYLPEEEQVEFTRALQVSHERNQRLNQFMQNFASVARLPQPEKTHEDLRPILSDMAALMQHQIGRKVIDMQMELPNVPCKVFIDVQQFEQVLINILKNAIEAIPQSGHIRISLQAHPTVLQLTDSGTGISPDHEHLVFSPFFSTKRRGQGVGLTLVRDILTNHKLAFSLGSNGEGETVFEIRF